MASSDTPQRSQTGSYRDSILFLLSIPFFLRPAKPVSVEHSDTHRLAYGDSQDRMMNTKHQQVVQRAQTYLVSNPGRDSLSSNISVHPRLRRLARGEIVAVQDLKIAQRHLNYRLGKIQLADKLARSMNEANNIRDSEGLPLRCATFMDDIAAILAVQDRYSHQYKIAFRAIFEARLFVDLSYGDGPCWVVPERFLAFCLITPGVGKQQILDELEAMKAVVEQIRGDGTRQLLPMDAVEEAA